MLVKSTSFMTELAVEAAMLAGVRAVVLSGWAQLSFEALPSEADKLREYASACVFFLRGSVPHEWLLPQCVCAVHHGGAGTLAAQLRSGIPGVITPALTNDQHWWGQLVSKRGLGIGLDKTLGRTSATEVATAIQRCCADSEMRQAVRRLAGQILDEPDGAKVVAAHIDAIARGLGGARPHEGYHIDGEIGLLEA